MDTQGKLADAQGTGDQGEKGDGDDQRRRGLRLNPIDNLAVSNEAVSGGVLEQLSETNILGTNLLDALALGAGILYLLYGPKAIENSKRGLRGWLSGWGKQNAPAAGEKTVIAFFLMRDERGSTQVMAARVEPSGTKLLGQQPVANANSPLSIQESLQELMNQFSAPSVDIALLDPRLGTGGDAMESINAAASRRLDFDQQELIGQINRCSDAELEQLRAWLNKPSTSAVENLPIFQTLQSRNEFYQAYLPKEQASMASLIELSLALTWSQRQR